MKKNLLKASLWGILALSTLSSCRTEDGLTQRQQEKDMRFSVFVASSPKEAINYAKGFSYLMQRYDELHQTNLSGINNSSKIRNLNASTDKKALLFSNSESYVEFNISSKVITEENGNKWVVFPRVQEKKVIGLIIASLTEKETYVSYREIGSSDGLFQANYLKFQDAFNLLLNNTVKINTIASFGKNGIVPMAGGSQKCYKVDGEWVCFIEGVDLTKPGSGGGGNAGGGGGSAVGGGCPAHRNCLDPNGGGGGGDPSMSLDPCGIMKSKIATAKGREIIKDLEAKAKTPGAGETAYRQDKNGDSKMYQGEQDNVLIPIDNNMEGVYHNHPPGGVNMLSVKDIRMLLFAARMQSDDSVGNAFVGMISSSGNYFISFKGTKASIPVIYDNQIPDLRKAYERDYLEISMFPANGKNPSSEQLEQFFFKTIDNMGLTGKVNLIKEKDGATSVVKQDANGKPVTSDPC
ncbi:hypothetical protein BAX95_05820 [Elizabethkingia meningoseptica]|uniref:hypothetical protein n=1 Tax=Elizabethkingia meningoseptica TaxID=238 RepID=UPI000841B427|nr:hypothetical protein [Elizabethkingia meningoseptica]MEC4711506.1 hypothetical protein [Elizabethkingia meningoseptica]ODM52503.1 hypothetical protein BES09_12765 [Elizabethkingia meningoseptica]OHT27416.1 hypothetical protein BFF93_12775 [Elizabethkingia meningoseptica]OPC12817.1 hypothetical protein BAX93_03565 [Elizabethkingia meningoseptica]OPC23392.1 hypothetical protein BAX95_05820 [Elizabethkingia meningoseptica]